MDTWNPPVMWKPNESYGRQLRKFQKIIEDKYQQEFDGYWDFHKWSIEHLQEFWAEIWDFGGIICSKRFDQVIDLTVPMSEAPEWFQGAKLNYAENLLKYRDDHVAMILTGEDRDTEKVTFAQMFEEAQLYAAAFRKHGLKKGDVVACQMSNRKEAIYAMQAATSIGAIWTGVLPQVGVQAVLNRFKQVSPKFFITIDRFMLNSTEMDMLEKTAAIAEGLPGLEKVIIVGSKPESRLKDISKIKNSCFLEDFLKTGKDDDGTVPPMQFEQVSFSHPVFISYTSGTTGLPKALMHGCGTLMPSIRDFRIHTDSDRDTIWYSMSPTGWASWNMFATLLFQGQCLLMYEGTPYYKSPTYFWDLVDEHKVTNLFLSASVLDEFQKENYLPRPNTLKNLRTLYAGGSVVKPQLYDFMYEKVKVYALCSSAYGCTEFMGSCIIPETSLPVHRGEISALCLGTDIRVVDDSGNPVFGEKGELVALKPMPSFPLGLIGDTDGSVFREKYFSSYPGKFQVGDHAIFNPVTKGVIICCRSDETLKQRGCRFGSSELYAVVDEFPEVRDALCVSHYNDKNDERAVLFLMIRDGHRFSSELVTRIRAAIAAELTQRHVPDVIIETKDVPYNMNGKKLEITVKNIINKRPYNADSVSNPESLNYYIDVPELQPF